jgi:hypothetical protein
MQHNSVPPLPVALLPAYPDTFRIAAMIAGQRKKSKKPAFRPADVHNLTIIKMFQAVLIDAGHLTSSATNAFS